MIRPTPAKDELNHIWTNKVMQNMSCGKELRVVNINKQKVSINVRVVLKCEWKTEQVTQKRN